MPTFVFINCPNCKVKIKIDRDARYHDCHDCKYEFKIDDVAAQLTKNTPVPTEKKESIFGKFLKEQKL